MEFPACRHGQPLSSPSIRSCQSKKLLGLKIVSPQQCDQCYCRDHDLDDEDTLPTRLLTCAYLGGQLQSDSESRDVQYECFHPRHGITTLKHCLACEEYLFPLITPNMPLEMVQRLIMLPIREHPNSWWEWENVRAAHRNLATESIQRTPPCPRDFNGRGIVVVGGGRYFVSAYVTIRVLRRVGCQLPIELWHLDGEIDEKMRSLVDPYGVKCVNAEQVAQRETYRFLPHHWWRGWQLKAFALINCSFREVLLLDSDCYPVRNPEFLFDWVRYREWGAIFWPDLENNKQMIPDTAWPIFGIEPFDELPTESGQLLVNKELCWREINLALHYNAHADFVYHIVYGDKDTFPIAWQRLGRRYARMWPKSTFDSIAIRQYDNQGELLFIHRVHDKFRMPATKFDGTPQQFEGNQFQSHFPLEDFCFETVDELLSAGFSSH